MNTVDIGGGTVQKKKGTREGGTSEHVGGFGKQTAAEAWQTITGGANEDSYG